MIKIENNLAVATFELLGAQITSFKKKDRDFEYLYQPQEPFWAGRNPILFPLVGSTSDKILHINGKDYMTGNHGFVRGSEFSLVSQTDNQVIFLLKENAETLKQYPFEFELEVTYTLIGCSLEIHYEIRNRSSEMMPFTFGLHPAFAVPYQTNETLTDIYLEFSNVEPAIEEMNDLNSENGQRIVLSEQLFEQKKTLLFENMKSYYVKMTDGTHGVKLDYAGYRWIAFWKQPDAPFVCLEPWHGHSDFNEKPCEFKNREAMIHLDCNRSYTTEYKITIF